MKISKNQWVVIGVLGAIAIWYFFLRKKNETKESGYSNFQLDGGSLESSYGPEYGAYGNYGNESSYITCPEGQCSINWSYWYDDGYTLTKKEGSYCGSCTTGSPAKAIKATTYQSNYATKGKKGGAVGKEKVCYIKWTDDKGVYHSVNIPCDNLKNQLQ